eukprot:3199977-Pleurochrysis_carterae.AAC.5
MKHDDQRHSGALDGADESRRELKGMRQALGRGTPHGAGDGDNAWSRSNATYTRTNFTAISLGIYHLNLTHVTVAVIVDRAPADVYRFAYKDCTDNILQMNQNT